MHTDICGILDDRANLVGGVNLSYSFILSLSDECYIWEYFEGSISRNERRNGRGRKVE